MKLCRFGALGAERPGAIDGAGKIRDLSSALADIGPDHLSREGLSKLAALSLEEFPVVEGAPRMGVPFSGMSKFVCIGLNYSDHAAESNLPEPTEPLIFLKALSALCGPDDDVMQPRDSTKLDWEVELGVVIGERARYVSEDDALDYVAGYCIVNDVSERAFQTQSSQWDKGKGCDTFGPVGPYLVTADEVADPQNLNLWLDVNGKRMQTGDTSKMIFGVRTLIAYVSRYMTLMPGDIIATGTPPGVGMGIKPQPVWLAPGDRMSLGIDGMGQQEQRVVAWAK
jgi:2,4-diketo-3-deoxy-L-fuconate hydrolase